MSAVYKVWIEIEFVDEENDIYDKCDALNFSSTADFETEVEAVKFADRLHGIGKVISAGDYK